MFKTNDGVKHIYAEELYKNSEISRSSIIDIREPIELSMMSLEGARHIPMQTLLHTPARFLQKDKTYYILCRSGHRSYTLSDILLKQGYNVINIVGGILVIEKLKNQKS